MNKYHAKKTLYDGIVFDSKHEADRYKELKVMEMAGLIENLRLQVPYELIPAQYETYARYSDKTGNRLKDGRRCVEREVTYVADFVYQLNGKTIVEDAKGDRTKEYIIKRKLMLWAVGIKIQEV